MTYTEVADAYVQLEAEGIIPSVTKILNRIGGSRRDVLPLLRQLRAARGLDPALTTEPEQDPNDGQADNPDLDAEKCSAFRPDYDPNHPVGSHPIIGPDDSVNTQQAEEHVSMTQHDTTRVDAAQPPNGAPTMRPAIIPSDPEQIGPRCPTCGAVLNPDHSGGPGPDAPPVQRYRLLSPNWHVVNAAGIRSRLPVGTIMRYPGDLTAVDLKVNADLLERLED